MDASDGRDSRIGSLDILRGVALFIMVIVHVAAKGRGDQGLAGVAGEWTSELFSSKGLTMFAILFGASSAIMLRERSDNASVVARYLRRLLGIAAFGVLTQVFGYTVLIPYAVTAIPLVFVRNWSVRALVILALLCPGFWIKATIVGTYEAVTMGQARADAAYHAVYHPSPETRAATPRARRARPAQDSFAQVAAQNLRDTARAFVNPDFRNTWAPPRFTWWYLMLFLLGMLGIRLRVFERPSQHRPLIMLFMIYGALAWGLSRAGWGLTGPVPYVPERVSDELIETAHRWLRSGAFLAFTYTGGVLLLLGSSPAWERRLSWFSAAGRLALTNYVAQVILISVVFSPWGVGWSGLRTDYAVACGVLLFFGLAWLSRIWLQRFRFGPAEWVLRSLTYARVEPLFRRFGVADRVEA